MNISMKQTQRLREQTCGCQGAAKEGWAGSMELADAKLLYIEWMSNRALF